MARKRGKKINGGFVPIPHRVMISKAYKELSNAAKAAYVLFLRDRKSGGQVELCVTFAQAKAGGICKSTDTWNKIKRELVSHGIFDQVESGGFGKKSTYKESDRLWNYGEPDFKNSEFKPGFGSKMLTQIWKDDRRRRKMIEQRRVRGKANGVSNSE